MEKERTTNIVILGYDAFNTHEFKKRFEAILEENEFNNFSFAKKEVKILSDVPFKVDIDRLVLPVVGFIDETNGIVVDYFDDKKLSIGYKSKEFNQIQDFIKILSILIDEQSGKITALVFNFVNSYKDIEDLITVIKLPKEKMEESLFENKNLGAFDFSFSFSEDDYKKTFIISKIDTDNSSVYNITGNYHYDKFKDTKSTSRTKDYVKEQINTNFEKFLKEFDNLSDGVIKL